MARPKQNPVTRFMRYVRVVESGCHEWQAKRDKGGYGHFTLSTGVSIRAHRYAWIINNGEIPDGKIVCHHCDNPRCVNPEHLFVGTYSDNAMDMVAKGNGGKRRKLSDGDVAKIKGLLKAGSFSQDFIAKMYGVHQTVISRIWLGQTDYALKIHTH